MFVKAMYHSDYIFSKMSTPDMLLNIHQITTISRIFADPDHLEIDTVQDRKYVVRTKDLQQAVLDETKHDTNFLDYFGIM